MDIKAGEEHVRSEARDWRERALKAQAEIKRLQAEMDTDHVQHMLNIKRKDAEIKRLKTAQQQRVYTEPEVEQAIIEAGFALEPATHLIERAANLAAYILWHQPCLNIAKKWMVNYHEWKDSEQVTQHQGK